MDVWSSTSSISSSHTLVDLNRGVPLFDRPRRTMLRPINLVRRVGEDGMAVIESLYPSQRNSHRRNAGSPCPQAARTRGAPTERHSRRDLGVVLAVDLRCRARTRANGLSNSSRRSRLRAMMSLCSAVCAPVQSTTVSCELVAFVRAHHQQTHICVSYPVDIAIKALSRINIQHAVTAITSSNACFRCRMQAEREEIRDAPRLRSYSTPTTISCTSAASKYALRAQRPDHAPPACMLSLMRTLPPHRHAELRQQLSF